MPPQLTDAPAQPALEYLESASMLWDNTVNKAYRVKGEIQPLQNAAADGVRKDIAAFGEEVSNVPMTRRRLPHNGAYIAPDMHVLFTQPLKNLPFFAASVP